jgi:hypothetical protein
MSFPGFAAQPARRVRGLTVPFPGMTAEYTDAGIDATFASGGAITRALLGGRAKVQFDGGEEGWEVAVTLEFTSVWSVVLVDTLRDFPPPLPKAWAFTFDGHVFYVLHFADRPSLICDLTTGQWHAWYTSERVELDTPDEGFWNMFRGIMWRGKMIAADYGLPVVWEVDPESGVDHGSEFIERAVSGFMPLRGSDSVRQGFMRVTARKEVGASGSVVRMRFSDDRGKTWSQWYETALGQGSQHRIEYRSLGRVRAPGRLWEIADVGALICIDGADAELDGEA